MENLKRLVTEEEGATMVEYGLMVALIAVVVMGAVKLFGEAVEAKFDTITEALK